MSVEKENTTSKPKSSVNLVLQPHYSRCTRIAWRSKYSTM